MWAVVCVTLSRVRPGVCQHCPPGTGSHGRGGSRGTRRCGAVGLQLTGTFSTAASRALDLSCSAQPSAAFSVLDCPLCAGDTGLGPCMHFSPFLSELRKGGSQHLPTEKQVR